MQQIVLALITNTEKKFEYALVSLCCYLIKAAKYCRETKECMKKIWKDDQGRKKEEK